MRLKSGGLRIRHRMGKVSGGAATAEEHKKRVNGNTGVVGNQAAERSGSEAEQLRHPQQRTECRSETGDASGRSDVG